jgi:tricorn protease
VNHRADLNYLLDTMGAEIAIGHSYVRGGAMPELPLSIGGLLGADFAIDKDNGRYKLTRIYRLLDGTANRQTVLAVNSRASMDGARQVTVVPVANEQTLRTRAWVEANRRTVDKLSGGQLAYVYLPNTGQPGYTSFNRYYFSQQDKKGAVVDERYNGGGSAADYIIDALQRDFDGYFNNVAGDRVPFTSPARACGDRR